ASLLAQNVPKRFLGDVAVPDNEILTEGDISVKDSESEQERAEKIILMLVKDFGENALPVENHCNDISRGESYPGAAGKIIDAIHGREPLMLERLHPHDGAESHSDGEKYDANA